MRSRFWSSPGMAKRVAYLTIWPGIMQLAQTLVKESICIIGTSSNVDFWHDNWLGYVIIDKLQIPHDVHAKLADRVGDFLSNGVWRFTASFVRSFSEILNDILRVKIVPGEDERIWSKSLHGDVTARLARLHNQKATVVTVVWSLWTFRNKAIFEIWMSSSFTLINLVRVALHEMQFMGKARGFMRNDINDLLTLKVLKVDPRPLLPKKIILVVWRPPPPGWIKINTDGSAHGAPGIMVTGRVFRLHDGSITACFHLEEGIVFAFIAELLVVFIVLEWAEDCL
ncbi:hypothetical protein C2S51_003726 [Perilla frutescens var. frutescens]|nr:hypothetical protein C2S51_003726 [Perilla frutescens var. frutescens]